MKKARVAFGASVVVAALAVLALRTRGPAAPHDVVFGSFDAGERPPPVKSAGCGKLPSIDAALGDRKIQTILPRAYDPSRPYWLVIAFHGNSGQEHFHELLRIEDEIGDRAIVIYPYAVVRRVWGEHFAPHWGRVDDLPFFDAIVEHAKASFCVDERRVFAVGWSSGGYFANQLGCVRPDAIRAFASVAGGGPEEATCTKPVPAFFLHDHDDHDVLFSTGTGSRDAWLATNGCTDSPPAHDGCTLHTSCKAPVAWCETSGNGHGVPASARGAIGAFLASF